MRSKASKYHASKIVVDGIKFDSKKEYTRWCELKQMEADGAISQLRRQVTYQLIPNQKQDRKVIERAVKYVADFVYVQDGETVVEDVKGVRTKEYVIKRKLMLYVFGIIIKEV